MQTQKFKTRTEFIERKNISVENVWEIALDLGYSSVKLFSPNIIAAFPSFAIKTNEKGTQFISKAPKESIIYRDLETNEFWIVGELAQSSISENDTSHSANVLYSRDRYSDPMFKVITRAGLGIACMTNEYGSVGNKEIVVQTGLPEKYLASDKEMLKEFLSENHHFALKVGNGKWLEFKFNIKKDDVEVISQPLGTLFSVGVDNAGKPTKTSNVISSSCIVFDPGFGTLDLFEIKEARTVGGETFPDLGMKRVLEETSNLIRDKYGNNIPVPAMQNCLGKGTFSKVDRRAVSSQEIPFDELLEKANEDICLEAIDRTIDSIGGIEKLVQYKYFIITGGTSAAWEQIIRNKLININSLSVISGNQNDTLPFIFSNVRGYYLYRYNKLLAQSKKEK